MVLKFTTFKVQQWEKNNKQGLEELFEPTLENAIKLIMIGRSCDEETACAELDNAFDEGKELFDVMIEIAESAGRFTALGKKGAVNTLQFVKEEVEKRLNVLLTQQIDVKPVEQKVEATEEVEDDGIL